MITSIDSKHAYTAALEGGVGIFDVVAAPPPPGFATARQYVSARPSGVSKAYRSARTEVRHLERRVVRARRAQRKQARKARRVRRRSARVMHRRAARKARRRMRRLKVVGRHARRRMRRACRT